MVKIIYPTPYTIFAKVGRQQKRKNVSISEAIEADIPEVDADLAPVVISADMAWPTSGLPGQGYNMQDESRNLLNPTVKIRVFEDRYFVPLMLFSKEPSAPPPVPARPEDFKQMSGNQLVWMTGFEKPCAHQTQSHYETDDPLTTLHERHLRGELPWANEIRISDIAEGFQNTRADVVDAAHEDIGRYICIDGELWRSLRAEPCITYQFGSEVTQISLTDRPEYRTSYSGFFRLDRLDDCMDHVRALTDNKGNNTKEIVFLFENLAIRPEAELRFDDEAADLLEMAHETERRLHRFMSGVGLGLTPEPVMRLKSKLHDALFEGKEERLDEIANLLGQAAAIWPIGAVRPFGLGQALSRWEVRPLSNKPLSL